MATPLRTIAGSGGDPLAEAIELTRRLKLPHIRRSLTDLIPAAKAQRWDPAEVVRRLLGDEANLRTRKRAAFPAGKTVGDWDEQTSTIPRPTRTRSRYWKGAAQENPRVCGPSSNGKSHFARRSGWPRLRPG